MVRRRYSLYVAICWRDGVLKSSNGIKYFTCEQSSLTEILQQEKIYVRAEALKQAKELGVPGQGACISCPIGAPPGRGIALSGAPSHGRTLLIESEYRTSFCQLQSTDSQSAGRHVELAHPRIRA